jgi:hypothetical protein
MAKKFLTNLDLTKNQIVNVALHNLASAPGTPVQGQVYFNTTDKKIYYWDSTAWIDISGDIRDVIGGSGLSAANVDGAITLDVNVDNATIEIASDTIRVKDLGISTAKIADSAITTIKINANAVTLGKIQQIAALRVLGNLGGGAADVAEVTVITDMVNASSTTLATSSAIKTYIDGQVGELGNLEGGWDASSGTFPVGSSPVAGTKKGDYWYVTTAGTTGGIVFNVGDVIIANKNAASTTLAADWIALEVNRGQASTTVLGLVTLATDAEVQTGTDPNKVVTPSSLSARTATETRTGLAEIATQAEVTAGTDDTRFITPLKLVTHLQGYVGGYAVVIGDGSASSFAISHGLNSSDVVVSVYDNTTKEEVITDVTITSAAVVTVGFALAPAANAYRVVIKK